MLPRTPAALAIAVLALLAGCSGTAGHSFTVPYVGPADVDVDTPALREAKAAAGIEDCPRPAGGTGSGDLPAVRLPCLGGGVLLALLVLRDISLRGTSGPPPTPARRRRR